jgi:hypothetical protein
MPVNQSSRRPTQIRAADRDELRRHAALDPETPQPVGLAAIFRSFRDSAASCGASLIVPARREPRLRSFSAWWLR